VSNALASAVWAATPRFAVTTEQADHIRGLVTDQFHKLAEEVDKYLVGLGSQAVSAGGEEEVIIITSPPP
jgi:hypothetical protein